MPLLQVLPGLARAVMAGALVLSQAVAMAAFPERPIRWIIDVPAGTTSDLVARLVGQRISENLGVPVIVESKPGATGAIAYAAAAAAPPDGYTIVMITTTLTQNAAMKPDQRATLAALVPIAPIILTPGVLVMRSETAPKDFATFTELWRQKKDGMTYASVGVASSAHLSGEYLSSALKLPGLHVPYTGTAPAFNDLIAGRVDFMFANVPAATPHLRSGRFKALAVSSAQRAATLPEVPTLAELGLPKLAFSGWFGVAAGAKVPRDLVNLLNQEITKAVSAPDIRARLLELGGDPQTANAEQFSQFVAADLQNWIKVIDLIGVKQ